MHHPKQRVGSSDPRKSIEEVVLKRRTVQAVANARAAELPRWKSAGDRILAGGERIFASPNGNRPRSSVHPMQGSVLHSRSQQRVHEHIEAASRIAEAPFTGIRSSTPNSVGSRRSSRLVTSPRPVTAQGGLGRRVATPSDAAPTDAKMASLNAKLDALAQRLQAVNVRSHALSEIVGGDGADAGLSAAEELAMISEQVNILQGETPVLAGHASAAPTRPATGPQQLVRPASSGAAAAAAVRPDAGPGGAGRPGPKALHNIMDNINGVMLGLEHIFITATTNQHQAATKITKIARGFVKRRRYQKGMAALRAHEERQSHGMARFVTNWLQDRRLIHAEIRAMVVKRDHRLVHETFSALAGLVWAVLPTRINQRQRAYYMMVKVERRLCTDAFVGWHTYAVSRRGAAQVALRNENRQRRIRDRVELQAEREGWREELVESVVARELEEDAVRCIADKCRLMGLVQSLRLWRLGFRAARVKRLGVERAVGFAERKAADRMFNGWKLHVEECKRWDADRYTRLRNERELQLQVLRAAYVSFFAAWADRRALMREVREKQRRVHLRLCREVSEAWQGQRELQKALKLAALERWLLVSKSKTQLPFRRWYLWCAEMHNRREAQTLVAQMLSRRWAKMRVARMLHGWWGETEHGAETGRGREELLSLLTEQQQINKALEETVSRYKELHGKTEVGLRKYEDILARREKQILRIENENGELAMRLQAAQQETQRVRDLTDLSLRESMVRKAQEEEAVLPPAAAAPLPVLVDREKAAAAAAAAAAEPLSRQPSADDSPTVEAAAVATTDPVPAAEETTESAASVTPARQELPQAQAPGAPPTLAQSSRGASPELAAQSNESAGSIPALPAAAQLDQASRTQSGVEELVAARSRDSGAHTGRGRRSTPTPPSQATLTPALAPSSGASMPIAEGTRNHGLLGVTRPLGPPQPQLSAPAPLPRIPGFGFSPAPTPDSIASARTPPPSQPTPPARRRAASAHALPEEADAPLADALLVGRAKHLMRSLRSLLDGQERGQAPPPASKLLQHLLELLERGTEGGQPVQLSGATLTIDAPEMTAPPRTLEVGPSSLDALNWNQLVVGLERFDVRRKRALRDGGPQGTDLLLDRLMTARASRSAGARYADAPAGKPRGLTRHAQGGRGAAW